MQAASEQPAPNEIKRQLVSIDGGEKKVINWWLEGTIPPIMNVEHTKKRDVQSQ